MSLVLSEHPGGVETEPGRRIAYNLERNEAHFGAARIDGPAIVNQYDTTTVVPPGIAAHVDRFGNVVIEVGTSAEAKAIAAGMEVSA